MDESTLSDLILVPTPGERSRIEAVLAIESGRFSIETIGFGVVASSVGAAKAIAKHSPSRVILAGIAGLFENHAGEARKIGEACWFDAGWIDGIGVGRGDEFQSAEQCGWDWFSHLNGMNHVDGDAGDPTCFELVLPRNTDSAGLLTVCSASANAADAKWRARRFPKAIAEDMESFSVAYACKSAGVPLSVVRGFSNFVGQRDHSKWHVEEALTNVAAELNRLLSRNDC